MAKLVLPKLAKNGHVTKEQSLGPVSFTQEISFAPIRGAIVYDVAEIENVNGDLQGKIRIGFGNNSTMMVMVSGIAALDALAVMDLKRGDKINLSIRAEGPDHAGHIVEPKEILDSNDKPTGTFTERFVAGNLLVVNGEPVIERYGHVELAAPKFSTVPAKVTATAAADEYSEEERAAA